VTDYATRVCEARTNVFGLEPGVALEDGLGGVASGEHTQHVLDG
jgi:hypothetical protein